MFQFWPTKILIYEVKFDSPKTSYFAAVEQDSSNAIDFNQELRVAKKTGKLHGDRAVQSPEYKSIYRSDESINFLYELFQ